MLTELHPTTRMVATTGDDDNNSWQDGAGGGMEVYVVGDDESSGTQDSFSVYTLATSTWADGPALPSQAGRMKPLLVADEAIVREFCRAFLLPSERPRILQFVGRKKYAPEGKMKTGTVILERVVMRFDKGRASEDAFVRELRKFEILAAAGMYADSKKGISSSPPPSSSYVSTTTSTSTTIIETKWTVAYVTA